MIVEQKYLEQSKLDGKKKSYNLCFVATGGGFAGHKHSKSSKQKISESCKGRVVSDLSRKRLSDSLKGRVGGFVGKKQSVKWIKNHSKMMQLMWKKKRDEKRLSSIG